jgi:hypothetical protein
VTSTPSDPTRGPSTAAALLKVLAIFAVALTASLALCGINPFAQPKWRSGADCSEGSFGL